MKTCIVLYFHNDRWLKRTLSIVFEELDKGNTPIVLDIGRYATPTFGAYYRIFGRISDRFFPFKRLLAELGVEYVDLGYIDSRERKIPARLSDSFELGIRSLCYSLLRTDVLEETAYGRSVYKEVSSKASTCYERSHTFLLKGGFEQVFIPNFRYASQKATMLAAIELGLKTRYFEADGPINLDRYLNHEYPVHDRVSSQMHALELTKNLSDSDLREYASDFGSKRFGVSPIGNQYSSNWSHTSGRVFLSGIQKKSGRKIGIFTSSVEEMWGLGEDWQAGWGSQWDAIKAVLRVDYLKDDTFVLRVHPNLGNKERQYFKREQDSIRRLGKEFPNLNIVPHNSELDSYELMDSLDLIVVFASTVGLEAALKGKPVLRLAPTFYDLLVDCSEAENQFSLSKLSEKQLFQVSTWQGAAKYVAYKELRSQPLHPKVLIKKRLDHQIPLVDLPLSSLPVGLQPLRYYFVLTQMLFRKLQSRPRTMA